MSYRRSSGGRGAGPAPIQEFRRKKEGRRKKEEGGRKKEEGRRRKEEGGRKKEEGRRRKEEGGRKKEEGRRRKEEGGRKKEKISPPTPPHSPPLLLISPFPTGKGKNSQKFNNVYQ
ncbi:hypothetical protein [Dolichospermum flos-aquae]|uniref:Uncharacterized protein n=1 Tax=Dolichospermum flos-aquae UHCC 0037 TaxID=2590026 RepID=A0ACC7S0U0_DOLFA|nr:hypothetical protein [Dolichospermum flos-aquae]MTJ41801.1 hypothetical protein [Dolichospermum flos-aquae UHCC 0037]